MLLSCPPPAEVSIVGDGREADGEDLREDAAHPLQGLGVVVAAATAPAAGHDPGVVSNV